MRKDAQCGIRWIEYNYNALVGHVLCITHSFLVIPWLRLGDNCKLMSYVSTQPTLGSILTLLFSCPSFGGRLRYRRRLGRCIFIILSNCTQLTTVNSLEHPQTVPLGLDHHYRAYDDKYENGSSCDVVACLPHHHQLLLAEK